MAPICAWWTATGGSTFSREVSVLVDQDGLSETIRRVEWTSFEQGGTLRLDIDRVVGPELVVRIENGDDAPLAVTSIEATGPVWELRANLPAGARLLYGNRAAEAPGYDVALLAEPMLRARTQTATLGEEEANVLARSPTDRIATWAGLGLLLLGLVGMAVRVLRASPPPDPAPEA